MASRTAYAGTITANDTITAANNNKLPGGWVGYATNTSGQTSITSDTDMTGVTVTLTLVSGRRYKVSLHVAQAGNDTNGGGAQFLIKDDGTQISRGQATSNAADDLYSVNVTAIIDGDGASHTVKATINRLGSTGNAYYNASSITPTIFLIEDVGPTS